MSISSASASNGVSYLYMAAAFVVVVTGIRAAEAIINPLLLAVFLAIISAPAYFGLVRRGLAEWLSMLIVIAGLTVIVLGLLYFVAGSIASFTARQDHYRALISERKHEIQTRLDAWIPDWVRPQEDRPGPGEEPIEVEGRETFAPQADTTAADVFPAGASPPDDSTSDVAQPSPDSDALSHDAAALDAPSIEAGGEPSDGDAAASPSHGDTANETPDEADQKPQAVPLDTNIAIPDERQIRPPPRTWRELVYSQFDPGTAISLAARLASSIGQLLSNAFLILLTVVFILLEVGSFSKKMGLAFVRTDETSRRASEIIDSIQHYLAIKTLMSILTGLLIFAWLMVFHVPYAGLWGLLAFLLNYIPNVGSIIAAIPAVLIAWLELTTMPAVATLIGYILVNTVVGNFLEPRLMGRGLGLSVLVVFCSMLFWGWVLGPVGMLLSVPLTMTARIAMDGFEDTRWIATLMGNAGTVKVPGDGRRVVS